MSQTIKLPIDLKRLARAVAGANSNTRVVVVPGDSEPQLLGSSYHWQTNGGRPIDHPNAYAKRGWSNMKYISSSLRVEVGDEWLKRSSVAASYQKYLDATLVERFEHAIEHAAN